MKKFAFMTVLASLVLAVACGGGSNQSTTSDGSGSTAEQVANSLSDKKLPFEHGSYVEVTKVMGMELKKTVYFDKWGDWTATEQKTEIIPGFATHNLEIVKGKTHWDIDCVEKTGTQYDAAEFSTGMAALGVAMAGEMAKDMKMEELGTEDYLGYKCKKVHVSYTSMNMDVTTLSYENLTMKMSGTTMGMETFTEIISIDLSAPPASIFEVPEGVEIQKM
jgi:hypothetical protein